MSTALPTARTRPSSASWSTSKRPASIRATAPARCRPIRSGRAPSPSSSARRARSPSRTVPFVAKVIGVPVAKIAARIMAGETLASFGLKAAPFDHIGVKEAVFPFARFPGVDTVLGPEMKSTGEVMGIDRNFAIAFAKSQIGGGSRLPRTGTVFVSVRDADKPRVLEAVRLLVSLGFRIIATSGTQRYLAEQGLPASRINKVLEGRPHIVDAIANGGVQLVFNTTEGAT